MAGLETGKGSRKPARDPVSQDLSPEAVSRAVLSRTMQQPYVLYPVAVGVLGGLAAALLGPSMVFLGPAIAGAAIGLGGWVLDYGLRREKHAAEYLRTLHASLASQVERTISELTRQFEEMEFEPGLQQIRSLQQRFSAIEALLRRKLDPTEMTFGRYIGMTEQVYLAGLDNLRRVADAQKGLQAIDVETIRQRILDLDNDGIDSPYQDQEIAALQERLALREQRQEKLFSWLAENQQAITRIDQAMAAIADMDTTEGHADMRMEHAMQELGRLAERASAYDRE